MTDDDCRLYLDTTATISKSDYINAVFVDVSSWEVIIQM